jgi:enoyl-CoA hydratase/carnithine racemase
MASEFILTETSAGVLSITLNRPEVLNSVTAAMSGAPRNPQQGL